MMATLSETYERIKLSIVAFVKTVNFVADRANEPMPLFPDIIGTGFVVDECGLVATNQHVVDAFKKVPRAEGVSPVVAVLMVPATGHMRILPVEIPRQMEITTFNPGENYSGPAKPDIALVKIAVRGLRGVEF